MRDTFIMEPTHQATTYYLASMHGEHISGGQAVTQPNFDALHDRSKPFWNSNYRYAYFHIPNALVYPAATASELCTIGTMARPGANNMVQVHLCSRVSFPKLGMTYDHTHSETSVLQSAASRRA